MLRARSAVLINIFLLNHDPNTVGVIPMLHDEVGGAYLPKNASLTRIAQTLVGYESYSRGSWQVESSPSQRFLDSNSAPGEDSVL